MSRRSAVALLVNTRSAIVADIDESAAHVAAQLERMLPDVERLLLDVRAGRVKEFSLEFPSPIHVLVSD